MNERQPLLTQSPSPQLLTAPSKHLTLMVNAIESAMPQEDLQYLIQRIDVIPGYFQPKNGKKLIQHFVRS